MIYAAAGFTIRVKAVTMLLPPYQGGLWPPPLPPSARVSMCVAFHLSLYSAFASGFFALVTRARVRTYVAGEILARADREIKSFFNKKKKTSSLSIRHSLKLVLDTIEAKPRGSRVFCHEALLYINSHEIIEEKNEMSARIAPR